MARRDRQAVVQEDERVASAGALDMDEIPQQELEEVHPVEEREVDAARKVRARVVIREELVAGHLVEEAAALRAEPVDFELEARIDRDRVAADRGEGAAGGGPDLEVARGAERGLQLADERAVADAVPMRV